MLTLGKIKEQSLPHIKDIVTNDLNTSEISEEQIIRIHKFISEVIWDYHRIYEPYNKITKPIVKHWLDVYFIQEQKDFPPPDELYDEIDSWGEPIIKQRSV